MSYINNLRLPQGIMKYYKCSFISLILILYQCKINLIASLIIYLSNRCIIYFKNGFKKLKQCEIRLQKLSS